MRLRDDRVRHPATVRGKQIHMGHRGAVTVSELSMQENIKVSVV